MGRTDHLSPADRSALAAFLRTIGTVDPEAPRGAGDPIVVEDGVRPAAEAPTPAPDLADPPPNPLDRDPLPEARSPRPTYPEWRAAAEIRLPRQNPRCRVFRVCEWVRVNCDAEWIPIFRFGEDDQLATVELLSGPVEGVELTRNRHLRGGEIVFPVRRGDRRVMTMHRVTNGGWAGLGYGLEFVITEAWLPGGRAPVITVN